MNSALKAPLRRLLDDRLPEERLQRLWRTVQDSRRRGPRIPARIAAALALGLVLLGLALTLIPRGPAPSLPLRLADGSDLPLTIAPPSERALDLSDGSRLEVAPQARLDVLQSTDSVLVLALRTGRVSFEVRPGGPRGWRIDCGGVEVEVVGTRFVIERSDEIVSVAVERGAVVVRGEAVPDHAVRLGAGHSLRVPRPMAALGTGSTSLDRTASAPAASRPDASASGPPLLAAPGTATLSPPAPALSTEPPGPTPAEALFNQADLARRSGDAGRAAELLDRLIREHPGDPHAALAAFSLGRLHLDVLGASGRAIQDFSRALALGLPSALAEDAQALLVEAAVRAGDTATASSAAQRYRTRYPSGRHLREVERWLAGTR
jgi:transmembrane sensor